MTVAGWYGYGKKNILRHDLEEIVSIKPDTMIFVPARINLRGVIESDIKIKTHGYASYFAEERETPSLFWDENLIRTDGQIYVFETNYCTKNDEILSLAHIHNIPERLASKFLRKVPKKVNELAYRLAGKEKDTVRMLKKFYDFVSEHVKYEKTTRKPLGSIMREYEKNGFFYGNCKEARDLYAALCNSKGLPTKKVSGKNLGLRGHVWVDVFVPVKKGYKLFPADAAMRSFGELDPSVHIFCESLPYTKISYRLLDFAEEKKYEIKIEKIA